jgi:hypothetical protein
VLSQLDFEGRAEGFGVPPNVVGAAWEAWVIYESDHQSRFVPVRGLGTLTVDERRRGTGYAEADIVAIVLDHLDRVGRRSNDVRVAFP